MLNRASWLLEVVYVESRQGHSAFSMLTDRLTLPSTGLSLAARLYVRTGHAASL